MGRRLFVGCFLAVICCLQMVAQIQEPVKFKTEWKALSENEAEIVFTGTIEAGWHGLLDRFAGRRAYLCHFQS